jgi:hypothetical protein
MNGSLHRLPCGMRKQTCPLKGTKGEVSNLACYRLRDVIRRSYISTLYFQSQILLRREQSPAEIKRFEFPTYSLARTFESRSCTPTDDSLYTVNSIHSLTPRSKTPYFAYLCLCYRHNNEPSPTPPSCIRT